MRLVLRSIAITLFLLAADPQRSRAQESPDDAAARAHFEAARLHYDRGAYEEAQREFQAAYDLSHRAELLYNLYLTTERLGDIDTAITHLERYLREGSPDAERRAQLGPRLENLRARRERAQRDREAGTVAPTEGGDGDDHGADVVAPQRAEGNVVPAAIAFGLAGAALVTFAITGGLALAEDGNLASGCGATATCTDEEVSTLSTLSVVADVSWVTATVATAAGVVLLLVLGFPADDAPRDEAAAARVVPWAAPDGSGGLMTSGSF
jgi:tetratricopeptide (TPR) repeat protein